MNFKNQSIATAAPDLHHEFHKKGGTANNKSLSAGKTDFMTRKAKQPVINNDDVFNGIAYGKLTVPLIKAVQKLSATVEKQEVMIARLQDQVAALQVIADNDHSGGGMSSRNARLYQVPEAPFSKITRIKVFLPHNIRRARVVIYNPEGKQLKVMPVPGRGNTFVEIGSGKLKAGTYRYALLADGAPVDNKQMVLTAR